MASTISLLTLWFTLGSSIGRTVSSAIYTSEILNRMCQEMPRADEATILKLYASTKKLRTNYPLGY